MENDTEVSDEMKIRIRPRTPTAWNGIWQDIERLQAARRSGIHHRQNRKTIMDTMTKRRSLHPRVTHTAGRITVVEVPPVGVKPGSSARRLAQHAARLADHLAEFVRELRDFHDRHCGGKEADDFPVPALLEPLSEQERTICELIAGGATHKRVAGLLDVSVRTVEGRLQTARIRLGLKSNSQLILRVATEAASDKRA